MRYVGVKSAAHFRAGFEPWAGHIQVISEPSVHAPSDAKLASGWAANSILLTTFRRR